MEKLQRALEKARIERKSYARTFKSKEDPKAPAPQEETETEELVAENWAALTPFVPDPQHLQNKRVTTLNAQTSMNPFDMLRTKIFLLMRRNGWTRLAITSPTKECGKTTTACNLATGFSRQTDFRTILFDTDLRKPAVARTLGHVPHHSIDELFNGRVSPQEQFVRLRDNVALSIANRSVSDPTHLLLADTTLSILQDVEDAFKPDLMIFDLPPMLVTDDARAFLKNVDCALIVARAEYTKVSHLDVCEREVAEHTNVLGVMLNDCRLATANKTPSYEEY